MPKDGGAPCQVRLSLPRPLKIKARDGANDHPSRAGITTEAFSQLGKAPCRLHNKEQTPLPLRLEPHPQDFSADLSVFAGTPPMKPI
jgi:hypothetical protein